MTSAPRSARIIVQYGPESIGREIDDLDVGQGPGARSLVGISHRRAGLAAMTLSWISDVPSKILVSRASRQWRSTAKSSCIRLHRGSDIPSLVTRSAISLRILCLRGRDGCPAAASSSVRRGT